MVDILAWLETLDLSGYGPHFTDKFLPILPLSVQDLVEEG